MTHPMISDVIFSLAYAYKTRMRDELNANELGLNGMHIRCLTYISATPNSTANDIVHHFSRDKAQIARLVKEMINNGWIVKSPNPEDKRSQLLSLTEDGASIVKKAVAAQAKVHQLMQDSLSEQELSDFIATANKIKSNLSF
ncbi:MarR family winged helix-turn-helix transcriptional regulator [Vibrio hippocampi]|uniref:Multidrug resistance operon repressor n=1 Tax=Vibrio hippocampi TaxID=654686 RepID=A0ABN8DMJ4_9VIBR|nr:MarR family winged helix-turn-helix transcriptional regulator [Vibrio hippocampi]CAH0528779.1 Multidrug resistance operon repressor [Vibrio hippocampi]